MPAAAVSNFTLALRMYEPKIRTYSAKMWRFIPGYDQPDLEQELLEVLWKCTEAYDPDNGAKFNTLFWRSAKNRTISIERQAKAVKRSIEWVLLDHDEFVAAVDDMIREFSAEDYAIALLDLNLSASAA